MGWINVSDGGETANASVKKIRNVYRTVTQQWSNGGLGNRHQFERTEEEEEERGVMLDAHAHRTHQEARKNGNGKTNAKQATTKHKHKHAHIQASKQTRTSSYSYAQTVSKTLLKKTTRDASPQSARNRRP